jgi:hypothetical protein
MAPVTTTVTPPAYIYHPNSSGYVAPSPSPSPGYVAPSSSAARPSSSPAYVPPASSSRPVPSPTYSGDKTDKLQNGLYLALITIFGMVMA